MGSIKGIKFELANINNIIKATTQGDSIYKDVVEWQKRKAIFLRDTKVLNEKADAMFKFLEKDVNEFIGQAKNLGIDAKEMPEVKNAIQTIGLLNSSFKSTDVFNKLY